MNNIFTLTYYTFREALSRKIFLTFFIISSLVLAITALIFLTADMQFFGSVKVNGEPLKSPVEEIVRFIRLTIVMPLYAGGLFLSVFSASSFIPVMLEKGNIDFLLSKPVSRGQILIGKFSGGVLIVLLNIAYLVLGLWFLIGIKFGVWDANLLFTIITITFAFALLYSMMILIGIITRNSVFAMMLAYIIFFILSPVLSARETIFVFIDGKISQSILTALYYIVPQTSELGSITSDLAGGVPVADYSPIYISILFIFLILGLSIFIFNKKDY